MKRLIASAFVGASLLLSAVPAHAQLVRTEPCPPGKVGRTIHIGDNTSVYNCYPVPGSPVDTSAIVRVTGCPPGYTGYVVQAWSDWAGWYDLVVFCIPFGP